MARHPETLIAVDYWSPRKALRLGYPWLVPEAIVRVDSLVTSETTVLELGSGGSTVWFAQRAASVVSYETSEDYLHLVDERLVEEGLANVELRLWEADKQEEIIGSVPDYDIVLLDSAPAGNRRKLLPLLWRVVRRGLVVDNYNTAGLSQRTLPQGWSLERYDDPHWLGYGTAICLRW